MNILFICGCMEPGKDGVGDYIRRLGGALTRSDQNVLVVALRDKYVETKTAENQRDEGVDCQTLRLPDYMSVKKALEAARQELEAFRPDWISLQFVPYAFDPKGLPFDLPGTFSSFFDDVKWHIMFHETYVEGSKSFKRKAIRIGQILILRQLVKKVNPIVKHTSIPVYQKLLSRIGIQSTLLGLFGNINISGERKIDYNARKSALKGIYFGASPKRTEFDSIARKFAQYLNGTEKTIELTFCGKANNDREDLIHHLETACGKKNLIITDRGEMSSAELSALFLGADFGMARIGPELLGKSGAALAMLEHGLPLFVPLADNNLSIRNSFDFRTEQCFHDLNDLDEIQRKTITGSRLPMIADQFLSDLKTALSKPE